MNAMFMFEVMWVGFLFGVGFSLAKWIVDIIRGKK